MRRPLLWMLGAGLLWAACIDFDASLQAFCASVTPERRAAVCRDGPQVVSESPESGATGVAWDAQPTVTFDQQVSCETAGLNLVQFTAGEPPVMGDTLCAADQAIFTPSSPLLAGRVYKVYITGNITNDAGTPALDDSWTFTTR